MSDLDRLGGEGESEIERALLNAGRAYKPEGPDKTRAALGLTSAPVPPAALSGEGLGARLSVGVASRWVVWGRWLLLSGLAGGAGVAGHSVLSPHAHPRPKDAPQTLSIEKAAPSVVEAPPSAPFDVASGEPLPSARALAPAAPRLNVRGPHDTLAAEVAALDGARHSLEVGDAKGAIRRVDRYEHDYPNGVFRPEARVVRVEALVKLGEDDRARAAAATLIARDPNSVDAARVPAHSLVCPQRKRALRLVLPLHG